MGDNRVAFVEVTSSHTIAVVCVLVTVVNDLTIMKGVMLFTDANLQPFEYIAIRKIVLFNISVMAILNSVPPTIKV